MDALIFWVALASIAIVYMTSWYGIARITGRTDVVDSAWGLGFVLVAWVSLLLVENTSLVAVVSACLASLWGIRLFAHIAGRNWRKSEDDHRYAVIRARWGKAAGRKLYTNIFLLQAGLLLLVGTPLAAIARSGVNQPNFWVWLGWVIWGLGIVFEAIADRQLAGFIKNRPHGSHALMNKGLWRYSRHPNYFGEVMTWWGAALVAVAVGQWWGIIGALTITVLITKVSGIPPLEKHYKDNADYQKYAGRTSVLVPLPPKNL